MRGSKNELFAAPRADVSRRRHTGAVWQARLNITEFERTTLVAIQPGGKPWNGLAGKHR
jgi:hypothetical protein